MNRKQLTLLVVLVAVLGGAGLMLYQNRSRSWTGGGEGVGQKVLGDFQVNDVAQIVIKHGTNELNLARKDDLWRVRERGDYAANFSEISDLVKKLHDLKVVQNEQVGPSQLPRLELASGSGTNTPTTLELRDASGKGIKTLFLGKKHMRKSDRPSPFGDTDAGGWPDGRYVMTAGAQKVALVAEALENVKPEAESWLNKDFFKVEKARSIAVTFPVATNSWKLTRETESGELKLADTQPGEQLDASKASGVGYPLSSPSFNDVAIGLTGEQTGLDKATVIGLETFEGFHYTVKVGQKTNDNHYLTVAVTGDFPKERTSGKDEKPEDKEKLDKEFKDKQKKLEEKLAQEKAFEKWTYLVSGWTVDSLLKERAQFMADKKDESKKDEAKQDDTKADDADKAEPKPEAPPAESKKDPQ